MTNENKHSRLVRISAVLMLLLICGAGAATAVDFEDMDAVRMFFAGAAIEESDVKVTGITPVGVRNIETVRIEINNTNSDEMLIKVNVFVEDHAGETIWTDVRPLTVPSGQGIIPMQVDETISMSDVMRMDVVIQDI